MNAEIEENDHHSRSASIGVPSAFIGGPVPAGRVVLLNGASSAGKSSIARALQEATTEPWLHTGIDVFLSMLPARYWGRDPEAADGHRIVERVVSGEPVTEIVAGPVAQRLTTARQRAQAELARAGFNLLIDEVLLARDDVLGYAEAFAGISVLFVGVVCPPEVASARERERGDRVLGLAAYQTALVHAHTPYDLELDSSVLSPDESATRILAALAAPPSPGVLATRLRR